MIEKFIDITIVYKRRVSLYGAENYILGGNFKRFLKENGFFNDDSILVGIARDNSSEIEPEDCWYNVGLIVNGEEVACEYPRRLFDNGDYLIIEVKNIVEAVSQLWQKLPNHVVDYELDPERPIIDTVSKLNQGYCEFCIPVRILEYTISVTSFLE